MYATIRMFSFNKGFKCNFFNKKSASLFAGQNSKNAYFG